MTKARDLASIPAGSGDFSVDGGLYLGGTTAANYLDDYEEGTWTPALQFGTSVSYTNQTGTYTKIGNLVYFEVDITATFSTDSSAIHISLPFAPIGSNRAALVNYDTDASTMFTYASARYTPLGGQISSSNLRVTAGDGDYLLYNEAQNGRILVAGSYRIA